MLCEPSIIQYIQSCPAYKICFAIWESTKHPDRWANSLAEADEVWVPTQWGRSIVEEHGIHPDKIQVIPEGVNIDYFRPEGSKIPVIESYPGYKFLHVGKAEPRKSTCELLQAFDQAFSVNDHVQLVIACHNWMIPNFNSAKFVENLGLRNRQNIVIVQPISDIRCFAGLYRSCDAFIMPSRSEGWGLPALEAMASGLPTAVTHYSGLTEFCNDSNSIAIPFKKVPIMEGEIPHFERADGNYGEWALPCIDSIAEVMKLMYQERDHYKALSLQTYHQIRDEWGWEKASIIVENRLRAIHQNISGRL